MELHPLLLCIETSSPICSVAIGRGDVIVDELISEEPNGHSKYLTVMVNEIMQKNKLSFADLDAIVVNAGPGSYTGLRIGMSTTKGLCYAMEKPMISISAFESMTQSFLRTNTPSENDVLLPMIDARRMEVYTQAYSAKGIAIDQQKAYISGDEGLFLNKPTGKIWIFGSGAEKMFPGLSAYDAEANSATFISASGLIYAAQKRWVARDFDDIAYTVPNYGKAWQKG